MHTPVAQCLLSPLQGLDERQCFIVKMVLTIVLCKGQFWRLQYSKKSVDGLRPLVCQEGQCGPGVGGGGSACDGGSRQDTPGLESNRKLYELILHQMASTPHQTTPTIKASIECRWNRKQKQQTKVLHGLECVELDKGDIPIRKEYFQIWYMQGTPYALYDNYAYVTLWYLWKYVVTSCCPPCI